MAREAMVDEACAAALASLPEVGPRRLTAIVERWGWIEGWEQVRSGRAAKDPEVAATMGPKPASLGAKWARDASGVDLEAVRDAHRAAGIDVVLRGSPRFPAGLADDLEPPMVLFVRGDLDRLAGPRAGIVGTRRATSGGRQTAAGLGYELASAGVRVVSGLALGIDGAAHQGALRAASDLGSSVAPVVGVVGTGLDVVYPRQHADLWRAVGDQGLLLSEVPLGGQPTRWRFPARNRLIAALSDVLVVVESHRKGGALLTVDDAQDRATPVMAVPGSIHSPASGGTNELLAAGAPPVLGAADVLAALDLSACDRLPGATGHPNRPLDPGDARLLDQLGWEPVGLDGLASRSGLALGELSLRLARLEASGWIIRTSGTIEQVAP